MENVGEGVVVEGHEEERQGIMKTKGWGLPAT